MMVKTTKQFVFNDNFTNFKYHNIAHVTNFIHCNLVLKSMCIVPDPNTGISISQYCHIGHQTLALNYGSDR